MTLRRMSARPGRCAQAAKASLFSSRPGALSPTREGILEKARLILDNTSRLPENDASPPGRWAPGARATFFGGLLALSPGEGTRGR